MAGNWKQAYKPTARAAPFDFYNCRRFHQSLNYRTPEEVLKGIKSTQKQAENKIN